VQNILRKPIKGNTQIVKQRVLFVLYPLTGKPSVFVELDGGECERLTDRRRDRFRNAGGWEAATRFGEQDVVVPTYAGAMIYHAGEPSDTNPTLISSWMAGNISMAIRPNASLLSTGDRFLVWSEGKDAKAVLVDQNGQKELTADTGWFERPLQFILLADGSILGIGQTDDGIELKLTTLEAPAPRTPQQVEKINALARELANRDPRIREKTQRELEAMGPGIHPELEAIRETLPVEAQVRIENILGQRFAPTLGGLKPLEGKVETIARFPDGGCVLLLTGGGTVNEDGEDKSIIPAWIAIRPGNYIERLPDKMVEGFVPGKYKLFAQGTEWIAYDPVLGVRRWMGAKYETLLPKSLRHFDIFVGIDASKRWIFRSTKDAGKTLIIDPSLPDATPRLPVWTIDSPDGAGWTDTGWPAVKRGKQVFVLGEKNWRLIDDKTEKFVTEAPKVLTTLATNGGSKYELLNNRVTLDGASIIDDALGASSIYFADGRLFLAGPGAVSRFSPNGKWDQTFTKGLPPSAPKRTWLDPAGRLVFAGESTLWVSFPTGRIPASIKALMMQSPADQDE